MSECVLFFGAGDVALKIASGLLQITNDRNRSQMIERVVFAEKFPERAKDTAEMLAACSGCRIDLHGLDGTDAIAVKDILRKTSPDLIIQASSMVGPWQIFGIDHPVAHALSVGGIALQTPTQLPVLLNVMRCVRDQGISSPVANISMPDIAHAILHKLELEPDIGLGNVSILHLRARAALRAKLNYPTPEHEPELRLIGHHHHVYGVMQASPPDDPSLSARVYVGSTPERDDQLAYAGHPFPTGPVYNVITAAAALPVHEALLPGGRDLQFSAPAPSGLPGGYPVRIQGQNVSLDLPDSVSLDDAIAFNQGISALDGVQAIGDDGTLHFTDKARASVQGIDPRLAEPMAINELKERTALLLETVNMIA